jgi:hypothetical protein
MGALRAYADDCVLGPAATPHVAVWGDSYGVELAEALMERISQRGQSLIEVTASACPPAVGPSNPRQHLCDAQNRVDEGGLITDSRIQTIVFVAHFSGYRDAQGVVLASFVRAVREAARAGKRIILIDAMPTAPFDAPAALGLTRQRSRSLADYGEPRAEFEQSSVAARRSLSALAAQTDATLIEPDQFLCDAIRCHTYLPGRGVLYFNRDHLSMAGARLIAEHIPL